MPLLLINTQLKKKSNDSIRTGHIVLNMHEYFYNGNRPILRMHVIAVINNILNITHALA